MTGGTPGSTGRSGGGFMLERGVPWHVMCHHGIEDERLRAPVTERDAEDAEEADPDAEPIATAGD